MPAGDQAGLRRVYGRLVRAEKRPNLYRRELIPEKFRQREELVRFQSE
jgi:hypothetical protein